MLNTQKTWDFVDKYWDNDVIPPLSDFIRIPCKTRALDPNWQENGHLLQAANLAKNWLEQQDIPGITAKVLTLPNQSPFVYAEIPGTDSSGKTALFYGHLDKMPETEGWEDGLGPWTPVLRGDRLYGRGGADDGYAIFLPATIIKAFRQQNLPYPRCVMLLEASEECGSPDFIDYFNSLRKEIGDPSIIIAADAGGDDYERLWSITSLRGMVIGDLSVDILTRGVHSGSASGIVPSTFRIKRMLLSRIEDENTGKVLIEDCHTSIPAERTEQIKTVAEIFGERVHRDFPFVDGAAPTTFDIEQLLLNKTWRPTLSIIGASGIPELNNAGSVLRPTGTLKLSMRLPPTVNAADAAQTIKEILEKDPPYNAKVTFTPCAFMQGWHAPKNEDWFDQAIHNASMSYYKNKPAGIGMGGSISVVQLLGNSYPKAQFIVGGILSSISGEHGPNEFLHLPGVKKFTCCVAEALAALSAQR